MALDPNRVLPTQLSIAGVDIFTVPGGKKRTVAEIVVTNTDVDARLVTLHHLGSGQSPLVANAVAYQITLAAKQVLALGRGWNFVAADKLHGLSDANSKVNVTVHFMEENA